MSSESAYVVSIKLRPDDQVTGAVKKLLDDGFGGTKKAAFDGVKAFRTSFEQMGAGVRGLRSELQFLKNTYQTVAGIAGVSARGLVETALGWSVNLENLGLSVATVLSAVDTVKGGAFADFNAAQQKTADLFVMMRAEAKATPSEFEDIAETFQTLLPLTRKLTPDLEAIVKLSANASSWDIMAGTKGVTGRDIRQILGGQLAITQIQNPMLKDRLNSLSELSKRSRELEKSGGPGAGIEQQKEMLAIMTQLLDIPPDAKKAWENSFQGIFNNIKGQFKVLWSEGSGGVFGELKEYLKEVTAWMNTPAGAAKITQAAKSFAEFVKGAAIVLHDVFKFFYDNFGTIKDVFVAFVKVWALTSVIKLGAGLWEFAKVWKMGTMVDFIKALAGFKTATVAGAVSGTGGAAVGAATGGATAAKGILGSLGGLGKAGLLGFALSTLLADDPLKGASDYLDIGPTFGQRKPGGLMNPDQSSVKMTQESKEAFAMAMGYGNAESAMEKNEKGFSGLISGFEGVGELMRQALVWQALDRFKLGAADIAKAATTDRPADKTKAEVTVNFNITGADGTVTSTTGTGAKVVVKAGTRNLAEDGGQ